MRSGRAALLAVVSLAILSSAVAQAEKLPKWIDPTDEVVSDHIAWDKPSLYGPMRVLFITHRNGMREVIEVCERFDIDREVAGVEKSNRFSSALTPMQTEAWKYTDEKSMEGIFRGRLARNYDCIVVAGIEWRILPEWIRAAILGKVKAGAGLVCRLHGEPDEALKGAMENKLPSAPDLSAFPVAGLPAFSRFETLEKLAKAQIEFSTFGKGRIVELKGTPSTTENWGFNGLQVLTPECGESFPDFHPLHYDYYQALVGHLMSWAAGRSPSARVVADPPLVTLSRESLGSVDFSIESDADLDADLEFVLRDSNYGDVLASAKKSASLARGRGTVSFDVKGVPAGTYFADLWIRQGERTINYGSLLVKVESATAIADLSLEAASFSKDEPVKGTVGIKGMREGLELILRQRDNFGRLVAEKALPVDSEKLSFELEANSALTVVQTVEAALSASDETLDVKRRAFTYRDVFFPRDDFMFVFYQSATGGSYLTTVLAKACHDKGADAWTFAPSNGDHNLLFSGGAALANLYVGPMVYGRGTSGKNKTFVDMNQFWKLPRTQYGIARNPCLTDPAYVEAARITYSEEGACFAPVAPAFYNLGDESVYAPHGGDDDLCFSETCVKDFQDFVRADYGSIDKLNAEYGTSYASFDEVFPVPLEKALADPALAPVWIDHRRHSDMVWARHIARVRGWLQESAPGVRVGYEGAGDTGHGPRNGALTATDYYRLARSMDVNGMYHWPYQLDVVRDFSEPGALIGGGWFGGYEQMWRAGHDPLTQGWWVWNGALRGANSIWAFDGLGGNHWSVVAPDFSFYDYFGEPLKQARVLKEGVGKLLMSYSRANDGIAVLYSPSSMLLASLEDQKDGFWDSADSVPIVLEETLFQYKMVASPQIEGGELGSGAYRALYLPCAQALSDKEVARILDFARKGGAVIADLRPAVADEHGKPRSRGALDELFGVRQKTDKPDLTSSDVKVVDVALAREIDAMPALRRDASLALDGGKALGDAGGVPAVIVNDYGAGKGILLNMRLVDYVRSPRDSIARFSDEESARKTKTLITELLKLSSIRCEIALAPYVPGCHVHRFQSADARLIGLDWVAQPFLPGAPVLEPFDPEKGKENARTLAQVAARKREVRLDLPKEAHVYDVLSGTYLGLSGSVARTVSPSAPQLLAAFPYKVDSLEMKLASEALQPGERLTVEMTLTTDGAVKPVRHVFRVEFADPSGNPVGCYALNLTAEAGRAECVLPLALNELAGKWTISARDVATGTRAQASFVVQGPGK
ncbi:MAG: alpha-amylase family protein [Planctomycetota bacterium]